MEIQNKYKAAIYIRVSTEEQAVEGQSASAQEEILRQYCSTYNIEVFDVYMDLGISGKSLKDRQELRRLIDDCGKVRFDMVLVWKISRLSRNLKDLLYLIDLFESRDVHFASYSEKFDTSTPVGRMTLQLLGSIAEFERNTIIENVRLGLTEFARKGGKAAVVLGYDNIDKKLIINEYEADIVKLIYSLRAESGLGFSAIAGYLNNMGYRTKRGCKYRSSSISYIIRNPVYIGINRHKIKSDDEYCIKSMHPAIIAVDLWNKAQDISKKPAEKITRAVSDTMPLKVYCLKCDSLMKIFYASSKGKSYKYLRCCNCSNYINVEKLLNAVTEKILDFLNDRGNMEAAYNLMNNNPSVTEHQNKELTLMESEICRLQKLKAHYLKLFESYKISEVKSFIDRIKEIEQQLSLLEKERLEKSSFRLAAEKETDYERYFAEKKIGIAALEPSILKEICNCLVKSIKAYKNEVNIVLYL